MERRRISSDTRKDAEAAVNGNNYACNEPRCIRTQPYQCTQEFLRFTKATKGRLSDHCITTLRIRAIRIREEPAVFFCNKESLRDGIDPNALAEFAGHFYRHPTREVIYRCLGCRVPNHPGDSSQRSHRRNVHDYALPLLGHYIRKYARREHGPQKVEVNNLSEIINIEIEKILFRRYGCAGHIPTCSVNKNVDCTECFEEFFLCPGKLLCIEYVGRDAHSPETFDLKFLNKCIARFLAASQYRHIRACLSEASCHFGTKYAGATCNEGNLSFKVKFVCNHR